MNGFPHGSKLKILKTILWIESIPVTRGEENNPVGIKHLCMNSFYLGIRNCIISSIVAGTKSPDR